MSNDSEHLGQCFCGAVEVKVTGSPAAMGYCHCASCRHWSAGPVNGFSLWPQGQVEVTRGAERLKSYAKTPASERKWCADCGGHVLTDHPGMKMTDVYAAILPTLSFAPGLHVFYGEKMVGIPDGLPKFADLPAELGGSGDTLPE